MTCHERATDMAARIVTESMRCATWTESTTTLATRTETMKMVTANETAKREVRMTNVGN